MTELPDLLAPDRSATGRAARAHVDTALDLSALDYRKAMAIPGAIYDPERKGVILPVVTPRAAIVALQLFPNLGSDFPELIEARDQLMADVHPTDYATQLDIEIEAPYVHDSLLEDGHDWLEFGEPSYQCVRGDCYEPCGGQGQCDAGVATQSTDLGYAAAILDKHGAFYLGWSRGYGKTLGTAAIIEANGYTSVLIAVPNTAKQDVWLRELTKRLYEHAILVMGNTPKQRAATLASAQQHHEQGWPFVLVVHHEVLALVAGAKKRASGKGKTVQDGWKKLGIEWDLFAFDECHRLKSSGVNGSLLHRAACKVPAGARLGLSGSVYENNWEEVYGPLHWLLPDRYSSKWDDWCFRFFEYVEGGHSKIFAGLLDGKDQALRDELGVFMIVRDKPDKSIRTDIYVDLSPGQRKAYEELQEDFVTTLDDGTQLLAQSGLSMLTRLRQIASGLELLTGKLADSTKLDAAMQVINDHPDDDFFVACWYKASAYALSQRLEVAGYRSYVITGDVPMAKRAPIIEGTRARVALKTSTPTILIGTIPTLGESANLQHLNHVIPIDRSFNPALNRQVVDRCDRTGQTREVRVSHIIARNTVDELVVMPNLANKDAFRALVLGRGA